MAFRLSRRLLQNNLHVLKDAATYEQLKMTTPKMLVGWFSAHFSGASKMYESQFDAMAKSYPQYTFFKCDVDSAPTVAYDAEVDDAPMVVMMPLGLKEDGTHYDKSDWQMVKAPTCKYDKLIPDAKAVIDSYKFKGGEDLSARGPWKFDPLTGGTLPPHQTY
uniref:Thioredoxin domain-containing protein n=1 Tax=Oxyrrhis marina TaxID=2969 RepID=A0A6U9JYV6_OXYMA